ncbi:MAG: NADPH-dependent F420 reductase [Actinomycetota bacterium]|nr:NADPH-dependent F420 reductase [Actinomycetota bacterium]
MESALDAVAVIGGTGAAGFGLATRWAAAGLAVIVGSRDAVRAEEAAARLRSLGQEARARGFANPEAAASAQAVVVAVPYAGQAAIYKSIAEHVRDDAVVVDCTVPLAASVGGKASHVLGVWEGSAAQQGAARLPPGVTVCAAFHSLSASALGEVGTPCEGDVLVCGPRSGQGVVRELVEAIPGLRYVNAGPLENARYVEPLTSLLIGINRRYKTDRAGLRITGI